MQHDRRRPDDGFSLIEVIVALGLIAILAAIVAPSYAGLQSSVRQAATLADLGSDRTALVGYATDNSGMPPASTGFNPKAPGSDLVGYGWQQSVETMSYRYYTAPGGVSWCLEMTNVTGAVFRISGNTPSAQATCAALGPANY